MAFVPGFQHDVFISYAWVNNPSEDAEDPSYQWVSRFKKRLATRLDEGLGRKDSATFFFDTSGIKKHQDFQPQTAGVARQAVFLGSREAGRVTRDGPPAGRCLLIVARAKRVHEVGPPPATDGHQRFALVKADRADGAIAREVIDALKAADVNCSVTHNGKSMLDRLREVPYDALLVVSVGCPDSWLEDRGNELLVVDLNLKSMAPVRAYYVDDPHRLLRYEGKDVLTVVHKDPASLQRLIGEIQRRGGRA